MKKKTLQTKKAKNDVEDSLIGSDQPTVRLNFSQDI